MSCEKSSLFQPDESGLTFVRSVRISNERGSFSVRSSAERGICALESVRSRFEAQPVQNLSLRCSSHFLHGRNLRWLYSWRKKKIYIKP